MKKALIVAAAFALTACSGGGSPFATPTPTPTGPPEPRTYSSVVELRDAAVAAGYDCPEWAETNVVKLAAGSGRCSDQDVFSVYLTQQDVSTSVQNLKALGAGVHLLTGPNWIINVRPAHLEPLREKLGGTIVIAAESTR